MSACYCGSRTRARDHAASDVQHTADRVGWASEQQPYSSRRLTIVTRASQISAEHGTCSSAVNTTAHWHQHAQSTQQKMYCMHSTGTSSLSSTRIHLRLQQRCYAGRHCAAKTANRQASKRPHKRAGQAASIAQLLTALLGQLCSARAAAVGGCLCCCVAEALVVGHWIGSACVSILLLLLLLLDVCCL